MERYVTTEISNSYTMGCPSVRGDNPRALASGLSYVQVDKPGITILYHLHQFRTYTSRDLFVCFVALRPKSTAMVIAGRSVHLTTLFPGQA